MNLRLKRHTLLATLAAAACLVVTGISSPAFARGEEPEATRQTVALSAKVGKKLQELQLMVEEKQYAAAAQGLRDILTMKNLSSYEKAQIYNLTAYNHYLQEDYQGAIRAYEQVLAQEIPPALRQSSLKTVAQLYFTIEDYENALRRVQELISIIESPSADVLMLLGQAFFQAGRYSEALGPIKEGIDLYKSQGKTPKENWLLLLRVCYYELQDYRGMVATLNELLRYYPKDSYMLTLAGAYSELGDTKKQLVITEVLYEAGIVTGSQHAVNLANLYLMHDIPYRAAEVLEKAMGDSSVKSTERNLRLLSQSWYQAREDKKSIPPLERAANMSDEGELFIRLAQSQLNLDAWEDAIGSINKGLSKGGVKRRDKAYVMLGMAHMNKKRLNDAESAFLKARDAGGSDKAVTQWLAFVANEKRREASMKQVLPDAVKREQDEILKNLPDNSGN